MREMAEKLRREVLHRYEKATHDALIKEQVRQAHIENERRALLTKAVRHNSLT